MRKRRVAVNDLMQTGYVYFCTEPIGKNFHADFHPELTPREMLELGVFGGKYMTTAGRNFPPPGLRMRGCPLTVMIQSSTALALTRRNHCRNGEKTAGSIRKITRLVSVVLPLLHGAAVSR